MRRTVWLACLLAFLPVASFADEVVLKSGGRLVGRILARTDTTISVDVGPGIITVAMSSVERVEQSPSALGDYEARAARLKDDDARGWVQLGQWAASQGLGTQARRAYERALAADPDNPEANRAVGRVFTDGRWMSELEGYRAQGMVQFEGTWMSASDRDAILTRRDAAVAAEWARLDADRRVREAEARAADAEARARAAEAEAASSTNGIPLWWGYGGYSWGYGGYSQGNGRYPKTRNRGNPETWPPSSPLGPWPSNTLGTYPSQPLGGWNSGHHGSRPTPPRQSTPPPPYQPPPPPPVKGSGAGAGAQVRPPG